MTVSANRSSKTESNGLKDESVNTQGTGEAKEAGKACSALLHRRLDG